MNGHEKRRLKKMNEIKKTTFALCNQYGAQKISVDEIAEKANVSKATIYKYFGSKEELIEQVISDVYDKMILDTGAMIAQEGDFLEKLHQIMQTKLSSFAMMQGDFLQEIITPSDSPIARRFHDQIKELMYTFFDQGKAKGYIDPAVSNTVLYAYSEIFNTGFQSLAANHHIEVHPDAMTQLIHLYFHGFIQHQKTPD